MAVGVLLAGAILLSVAEAAVVYQVPCNYSTPSCECPVLNDDGEAVDVCSFALTISLQHTFFRYVIDPVTGQQGPSARVYVINENGEEVTPPNCGSACGGADCSSGCTEAYMVDGYTFRTYIAVNNRIPGATLIVNHNQTIMVNVTNVLYSDDVSVHWHGMDQVGTNWMDGVQHITQCGIPPQSSFTYIFKADPPGTYWYHSHTGAQRTDGLFGALIIRDDPALIDQVKVQTGDFEDLPDRHTLTFIDWQLMPSIDLHVSLSPGIKLTTTDRVPPLNTQGYTPTLTVDDSEVGPLPYWSGLINGKGRHVKIGEDDETVNYTQSRLSVFTVSSDNTYRFRLVGAVGLYAFIVSVDEHNLTVIATDGVLVEPVEVQYIIIHSGERYDFLLDTKSSEELENKTDFMIRAETLEASAEGGTQSLLTRQHFAEAILHYGDPEDEIPSTSYESIEQNSIPFSKTCTADSCLVLNCPFLAFPSNQNLSCFHVNNLTLMFPPEEASLPDIDVDPDAYVFLNFGFEGVSSSPSINARTNMVPSSALAGLDSEQLGVIEEAEFCKDLDDNNRCSTSNNDLVNSDCACVHAVDIPFNKSIQLVFSAVSPNPTMISLINNAHPIHLHGHHFHLVDMKFGNYSSDGRLVTANDDIDCGGDGEICNNPSWKPGRGYDYGQTGKIPSTAPLKDTVLIPAGGYVVAYITSNNPGYWFLHCHIEVHQLDGMAVVIAEAIDELGSPPDGLPTCGNFTWTVEEYLAFIEGRSDEDNGGVLFLPSLMAIAFSVFISCLILLN